MFKNGFTLIEAIIVIVIALILSGLGLRWYLNYEKRTTIEGETHKVYQTLKEVQLKAKVQKQVYCVDLSENGTELRIHKDACSNKPFTKISLNEPFQFKNPKYKLKVNKFGVWLPPTNSLYAKDWPLSDLNCVKADDIRICEGSWDNDTRECKCKY